MDDLEFPLARSAELVKTSPKGAKAIFGAVAALHCPHCGVKHRTLTPDQCVDRRMSEKTLQARVMARAKRKGWVVKHIGKGMTGADGIWISTAKSFPDLFMLHPTQRRVLAIELKKEEGEFEPGQLEYLQLLNLCGIPAVPIRPSDLREGRVNAILGAQ
jgi:hypothetical protein